MANIKLFGNTKIQGKAFLDLSGSASTPTYSIEKSVSSVDEGAFVTFTLTTTNVANGTSVPYTITGISAADITSGSLTGNFIVNNNTATVTITATADQLTEGAETATLTLDNVADFESVTVNDTSLTPFSPDQIEGLRGWWDYTHEVYRINGNDFTDATASVVITIAGIPSTVEVSGTTNNKNRYGGLYWNNTSWVIDTVREAVYDDDGNLVQEAYTVTYTSSGNTQYPWQANWSGSGASVTRTATTNSVLATNDQTIALWKNKITSNGNFGQSTLNNQPTLRAHGIELSLKSLAATGMIPLSFRKTYYIIAKGASTISSASRILATSSASTTSSSTANLFRNALFSRNSNGMKYGLSNRNLIQSSFSTNLYNYELISVSFDTVLQQGKIQINNQNEETLNGIGNVSSDTYQLYLGSTGGYVDVKEILVYDGLHTSQQKTQVINHLNAKYNLF